ncbi:hypothetical protein F2P79_010912 [Pimephales promelas]|nr:hypothetical protein F2P79_010912 [Pimephales promelas]
MTNSKRGRRKGENERKSREKKCVMGEQGFLSAGCSRCVANGEDGGWLEEERERERQKTEKEGASIIKNVILPLLNISRELQAEALQSLDLRKARWA